MEQIFINDGRLHKNMVTKPYIRTDEIKRKMSETRKKRLSEGTIKVWNKGLTKSDPRVLKNISGGSRKTQFKIGDKKFGKETSRWKGGRTITSEGYVLIRNNKHPANRRGYVAEHRLVMEKHIGRYLTKEEVVHHKDHNKENNDINNLMLLPNNSEHLKMHNGLKHSNPD